MTHTTNTTTMTDTLEPSCLSRKENS
jgi:hypothetical protein